MEDKIIVTIMSYMAINKDVLTVEQVKDLEKQIEYIKSIKKRKKFWNIFKK